MSVARGAHRLGEPRRAAVLAALCLAAGALVAVSSTSSPSTPLATSPSIALVRLAAESSATFCAGLESEPGVLASDVAVADLADAPRTLEVTVTNDHGRHSLREVGIEPGHVLHLDPAALLPGTLEAMSIVADGGGIAATEAVRGVDGTAVAPCATSAAQSWLLSGGSTDRGQDFELAILNPNASTAVGVTVSLATPTTSAFVPVPSLEDVVLSPYQLVGLTVHRVAPNAAPISALVTSATGGLVVFGVGRSTKGAAMISLQQGAVAPSSDVLVPLVRTGGGVRTQLLLTNPSSTSVTASVRVGTALGCSRCPTLLTESVGPGLTVPLDVASLAPRRLHAAAQSVTTGAEVVAAAPGLVVTERVTTYDSEGQSAPLGGATGLAERLVLVSPLGTGFDEVGLVNPGSHAVRVGFTTVGPHGARSLRRTVVVLAHSSLTVAGRTLGREVGGVVELTATGPITATGAVHGALAGSNLLAAVPAT